MKSTFYKWSLSLFILFILYGCTFYTNVPLKTSPESIEHNIKYNKLFLVHTKNMMKEYVLIKPVYDENSSTLSGSLVNLQAGKKPDLKKNAFLKQKTQAYNPEATIHLYTTLETLELGEKTINLSDISSLSYHEIDYGRSVLGSVATIGLVGTSAIGVFLAIACSCPEVTTFDDNMEINHGSLFPGSLLNSLERDDYLILNKPVRQGEEINIRVANVTTETQYINELELLEVEHNGFDNIALTNDDNLVAYNQSVAPKSVIENGLKEVSDLLIEKDGQSFQFDNMDAKKLNEVVLTFDKSALVDNPALVIHGQQSKWLDTVATVMLSQAGKYQEKWTAKKDNKISRNKWQNDNQKRGLSLNVYLKKDDKWEYAGTYHDVGTSSKRTLLMPLDLTNINTETVEVKLESAFKIWEIDYVGLTNSWSTALKSTPLKLNSATNQDGENVMEAIAATDEQEVVQEDEGTFIEINATTTAADKESSLVLHGFGYYHKHSKFENSINLLFFAKFKQRMGLHDVSKALYQSMIVQ